MEADAITQNPDRCIGCGLWVSTCPTDSIRLVRKPDSEHPEVPQDIVQNLFSVDQMKRLRLLANFGNCSVSGITGRLNKRGKGEIPH